jgi:hypothetical protein
VVKSKVVGVHFGGEGQVGQLVEVVTVSMIGVQDGVTVVGMQKVVVEELDVVVDELEVVVEELEVVFEVIVVLECVVDEVE